MQGIIGLDIIKFFEGFQSCPYLCPAGVPTIGYGTTIYPDGTPVTLEDDCISEETASIYLEQNIESYISCVEETINVEVSRCQFDAMVSLCYNIGCGAFQVSTLASYVNSEDFELAALEFDSWVYANGEVITGLQNRRNIEQALFELC
jgi:lysozyme